MDLKRKRFDNLIGWMVYGSLLVSGIAFVLAMILLVLGEYLSMSLCLLASSLALGLQTNAILRS